MIPRNDLLDTRSPDGLDVFQLTTEDLPSCHIYMEAQIFTPDSSKLIVHRSAHPHGSDANDPEHRYLLCDLDNNGELSPLTDETGPTGPSISPDGQWLYYFVDQTEVNGGTLALKRVKLDGTGRETICVVDAPVEGCDTQMSRIYPLSTISSDGKRIAISGFFGDGKRERGPWGLMRFDIDDGTAQVVYTGQYICNLHPQYSRSKDAEHSRDILIQENHDCEYTPDGIITKGVGSKATGENGCDIHVIRDDGSNVRNMPWGRDGIEHCEGHQCWRGRSHVAITSLGNMDTGASPVIEGVAVPHDGHNGKTSKDAKWNDLTTALPDGLRRDGKPDFHHFATDISGDHFITDANPNKSADGRGCDIYIAKLGSPMETPATDWRYLLDTRTYFHKTGHIHPFLSPNAKSAFFNSNESGTLQAYMIRNLPW